MPTLRFSDKFGPTERRILSRTFHQNCRDLGISNRDASIDVRRVKLPFAHQLGAISKVEKDRYILIINRENDLLKSIFCVGHEMVHFDQYSRGDLTDDARKQLVYWKGKSFPTWMSGSREHYANLPWEAEAISKHHDLMDSAMAALPFDERLFVCGSSLERAA
jgi:hypothetical protein